MTGRLPETVVVRVLQSGRPPIEYRSESLPITLGRDPKSDLPIVSPYVSAAHLRIQREGNELYVCDLGSTNGTHVDAPGGGRRRLARGERYPLSRCQGQFFLGERLQVRVESERPPENSAGSELPPLGGPLSAPPTRARSLPGSQLAAPRPLAPLSGRGEVGRGQAESFRPVPAATGLPATTGSALETGHFPLGVEALALRGLEELAASLSPDTPLESQGDVARLITRLHDTVESASRAYVTARTNLQRFTARMGLDRTQARSSGLDSLGGSLDSDAVAAKLVDFRAGSSAKPSDVDACIEELCVHQVALLEGVMKGVSALLEELSPQAIESQSTRRAGLPFVGSEKALWEAYCQRHGELANSDEALSVLFGQDFSEAYRSYRRKRSR